MPGLQPRKRPRQARAKTTFDAIVEAAARLLRERGLNALTTNHIAKKAGVSIGTLYEFFPNRDAILAELCRSRLEHLRREVADGVERALQLDAGAGVDHLVRRLIAAVSADRELLRAILRDAAFLRNLPETRRARAAFFEIGRVGGQRANARLNLPDLEAGTWLVSRMVSNAVIEIAFAGDDGLDVELLTRGLVRLTYRLLHGRDLEA